jgi:hypothetical protein
MTLFNRYQRPLWKTVETVMGEPATWLPSQGGQLQTATILFNEPTAPVQIESFEFNPPQWEMEYRQTQFVGLFEAVREGRVETVTIQSRQFAVREVQRKFDGLTFQAKLQELA